MLNLTTQQEKFITNFSQNISTQEVIEDLMLMYSAYVGDVTDTEKFEVDKQTFLDIQSKMYVVQNILELVAVVNNATTSLKRVV